MACARVLGGLLLLIVVGLVRFLANQLTILHISLEDIPFPRQFAITLLVQLVSKTMRHFLEYREPYIRAADRDTSLVLIVRIASISNVRS